MTPDRGGSGEAEGRGVVHGEGAQGGGGVGQKRVSGDLTALTMY